MKPRFLPVLLFTTSLPVLASAQAPGILEPGVTTYCDDWATLTQGQYKYENNVWGATPRYPYQQCLMTRDKNGQTQYGWTWHWQGKAPTWVFAYPEIIVGWKPWGESTPTTKEYPVTIDEIESLNIDYKVQIEASGDYNLAPEVWIMREKPTEFPMRRPQELITTEIMFWMDRTNDIRPAGQKVDQFSFGGLEYDLWLREDHNNSGNTVSWTVYSLVAREKQHEGHIDVIGLINKLIAMNYPIDTSQAIASIEFGNEAMGRTPRSETRGTTWVERFEVELGLK